VDRQILMNAPLEPSALDRSAATADLERLFALQRAAFERERFPELATRLDRLQRLARLLGDHEDALCAAINDDFGHRSSHETRLAELYVVASGIRHAQRHLRRWMKPVRVATPLQLQPARARIHRQPLGVVGIISPWNYPLQLALAPALGALAAGNRVLLKPSELTPRLSALLGELVAKSFRNDEFAVVTDGAEVGSAFSALPWDHLFFTGSTTVGRQVALAAAANLTPVTLELGGKSPAIFDVDADMSVAAPRLVSGKLLNAGQTCIAPDYALVPHEGVDAFVRAVSAAIGKLYPSLAGNPDYTSIVSPRHYARLVALVDDARAKGATIVTVNPAGETLPLDGRRLAPTLVLGVNDSMAIMYEEIFGPLLPVETYRSLDEVIAKLNARPRPLAFYFFGGDVNRRERVLRETLAGGVTVNDTLWHFVHEELPFGGVGASGTGAYHGERSFLTFSKEKPVFYQSRLAAAKLLYPPYGPVFDRVLALLRRFSG
jgi:coniferyl-aldehyde dehydrogenase